MKIKKMLTFNCKAVERYKSSRTNNIYEVVTTQVFIKAANSENAMKNFQKRLNKEYLNKLHDGINLDNGATKSDEYWGVTIHVEEC